VACPTARFEAILKNYAISLNNPAYLKYPRFLFPVISFSCRNPYKGDRKMKTEEIIDRKLFLKKQALSIVRRDIADLRRKKVLMRIRRELENEISESFDPVLSRKLDALLILLDDQSGERANG